MKKMVYAIFIIMFAFALHPLESFAAEPLLYFSDITSGPKTGLGDGKGSGVIVTVWGANLGSTQGASQISVGGVPASYVYYWGNADTTGASGPADLYTYHKMQTISFSVPAAAADGANTVSVTVNGIVSNTLPFTVRAGNIWFVKSTGVDANGRGSWSSPFKSMFYVTKSTSDGGPNPGISAGDTIYVADNISENNIYVVNNGGNLMGTASAPISLIAYPGALVTMNQIQNYGFGPNSHSSQYWNIAKITVLATGDGINTFRGMRAIANEITNYPGGCALGMGGGISGSDINYPNDAAHDVVGGGIKVYGNYIHNYGCDTTTKFQHTLYISNRGAVPQQAFEIGWNYLRDNKTYHALHIYDEGPCGDFTGAINVHDNVVKNQTGVGFGISAGSFTANPCFSMPVNVYNNLFINVGQENPGDTYHSYAIGMSGGFNKATVKIYNNTIYGFSVSGASTPAFFNSMSNATGTFSGYWEFVNNIVVNTNGIPYTSGGWVAPNVHTNNLWFDTNGVLPPPSWDTNPLTVDPQFLDATNGFFNLQAASPARGTGADTSSILLRDFRGIKRGTVKPYSIGAQEYISTTTPSAPRFLNAQ